jgi:subtilisin family serine protease
MGNSLHFTSLVSAIGLALFSAPVVFAAHAMPGTEKVVSQDHGHQRGTWIVRFVEPGLLHYAGGAQGLTATSPASLGQRKLDVHSIASQAYAQYLEGQSASHLDAITQAIGRSLDVTHSYRVTMNGIAAEMSFDEARKINQLAGVASVRLAPDRETTTYHGPQFIGAPAIWDGSGVPGAVGTRGQGIVVGVIDTGANSAHPSFADDPTCGVFGANNHKLLSAVDCLTTNGAGQCIGADPEANAGNGHGVHTASTAVGNTLDASVNPAPVLPSGFATMSGVASCASLRTYKVCATNNCTGAAIQAVIEGAIADQVDVINFSISGGSDPWNDEDRAFLDAVGADAFVAASAGNTSASVTDPVGATNHLGPWMTTVAASTHDLNVTGAGLLDATGPGTPPPEVDNIALTPGSGLDPGTVLAGVEIRHYAANEIGCAAGGGFPPNYFDGAVALISRGTCTFEEKIDNAQAAGALVAVIYNNVAGSISMSVGGASLPAYSIQQSEGQAFVAFIDSGGAGPADRVFANGFDFPAPPAPVTVDFTPAQQQGDVLAGFSLRGPSALTSITKPDITGPGVGIYAASDPASGNYQYLSGTSMSSPHLAGSAALIRAAHPDWTPAEVKSALMLTAVTQGWEDGSTPWTPDDVGAGRVDLTKAALAGFVLDEGLANFVAADPSASGDPKTLNIASARNMNCVSACTFTRTLRNTLTSPSSWAVTVTTPAGLDVTVDTPTFSFTGDVTETHPILITASPTTTLPRPTFAEITFHEINGAAPDGHLFVSVAGSNAGGGSVIQGTIDQDVLNDANGSTFDFVTGVWGVYDFARVDDLNLYNFGSGMYVYWYADLTAIAGGGVVDGGGLDFAVLHPGDTVGPASTFSSGSLAMTNWIGGADGYIGVAFQNENTGVLNYGFIHMTTSGPDGFPAHVVEYGYDSTGAAITIPVP